MVIRRELGGTGHDVYFSLHTVLNVSSHFLTRQHWLFIIFLLILSSSSKNVEYILNASPRELIKSCVLTRAESRAMIWPVKLFKPSVTSAAFPQGEVALCC